MSPPSVRANPSRGPRTLLALLATGAAVAGFGIADPVAATSPPIPFVSGVSPNHGPADGGNTVTISGSALAGVSSVRFSVDGAQEGPLASVNSNSGTQLVVEAPRGWSGVTADVIPQGPFGNAYSQSSAVDDYTWDGRTRQAVAATPSHASPAGGSMVTLTGAGVDFATAKTVKFGDEVAPIVKRTSTSAVVTVPAGAPITKVPITVELNDGHIDGRPRDKFTYDASSDLPVVTAVSPNEWFTQSNGSLQIRGTALEAATKVEVGGVEFAFDRVGDSLWVYLFGSSLTPGNRDVRVTTAVGTSADTPADDLTVIGPLEAPVVDSFSPASGSRFGGTRVTVRGAHLSKASIDVSRGLARRVKVISDTELQFTMVASPNDPEATSTAFSVSNVAGSVHTDLNGLPDFTFTDEPSSFSWSPQSGPQTGGTEVTVTDPSIDFRDVAKVTLGGSWTATITNRSASSLTFVTPPSPWAGPASLSLWDADGEYVDEPLDTKLFDYQPATVAYDYGVKGSMVVKTLNRGNLALSGGLGLSISSDAVVEGTLALAPATGRLVASGFLPVTSKVAFVPSGKTTGTWKDRALSLRTKVRIKLLEVKLFGAIPIAGGNNCQSRQLTDLDLAAADFDPSLGGTVSGTFAISDLNGCGLLNGLVSPLTASKGNTITLALAPKS